MTKRKLTKKISLGHVSVSPVSGFADISTLSRRVVLARKSMRQRARGERDLSVVSSCFPLQGNRKRSAIQETTGHKTYKKSLLCRFFSISKSHHKSSNKS